MGVLHVVLDQKQFEKSTLKLPREVEADPRLKDIEIALSHDCRPLWEKSKFLVPRIPLTLASEKCLQTLLTRNQLEMGLERIDRMLIKEQKGLLALQKKMGTQPSFRASRLLLVSNDGSERFYRSCEKIFLPHQDRVLLICIDESSDKLTQHFMENKEKILKVMLISERDAVSEFLFSLVDRKP